MRVPDRSSEKAPTPPNRSAVVLLLGDIADTSWRMFIPALSGIVGGYFADKTLGTKPWLFALGAILGCIVAGLLIKRQLEKYE